MFSSEVRNGSVASIGSQKKGINDVALFAAITRFQGDHIKGNPGVAGQIQPHGPTFQALERAVPQNIHETKVVKDSAQLFMPPRLSDIAAFVSARGQTIRDTDPVALALRALAEELLTRHGLLVEVIATDIEGAARTATFAFKGLRWIDNRGQTQSASRPTDPRVPAPFFTLFEAAARNRNEIDPVTGRRGQVKSRRTIQALISGPKVPAEVFERLELDRAAFPKDPSVIPACAYVLSKEATRTQSDAQELAVLVQIIRPTNAALAERIERLGRIMATPPTADTLKYFSNETIKTCLEQKGEFGSPLTKSVFSAA